MLKKPPFMPQSPTPIISLSLELQVYSVLDLKDAFFNLTLKAKSQPLFAFKWDNQDQGCIGESPGLACCKDSKISQLSLTKPYNET